MGHHQECIFTPAKFPVATIWLGVLQGGQWGTEVQGVRVWSGQAGQFGDHWHTGGVCSYETDGTECGKKRGKPQDRPLPTT